MQPLGLRFFGLVCLALFVFLAVSMASYSINDAPDQIVFPQSEPARNLCGPVGAYTASVLRNGLGLTAFFLFIPLGVEVVELLRGRQLNQIFLRSLGLGLVLIGMSGFCGLFATSLAFLPGPTIGPGGYLGTVVAVFLTRYVAVAGCCIFLACLIVAGLILIGDQTLLRILFLFRSAGRLGSITEEDTPSENSANETDTDEPIELESDEQHSRILPRWFASRPKAVRLEHPPIEETDEQDEEEVQGYELPSLELLTEPEPVDDSEFEETVKRQSHLLEKAFANYGAEVKVVDIQSGPVISQFELDLARGLRVNKIQALENDLAINLRVSSVRVVAPIPGKNTVGVELPNKRRQIVRLREVMEQFSEAEGAMNIPIYLGKDVSGHPMAVDLADMPHLLIAGRTGTGKSVCLNSIIVSILMTKTPEQVRMLMIDPKRVELGPYGSIPHLMHPVVTDTSKAEAILGWAVDKMEERLQLFEAARVRDVGEYNKLSDTERRRRMKMLDVTDEEWAAVPSAVPYLVIIVDEMSELMQTTPKEVETHIIRLAQKSRAAGIHLVLATQKPTVNVVTGLIKSNLPARIAFGVASKMDSLVILDQVGAERLLSKGDMLFLHPGTSQLLRGQGTYVDSKEIEAIIEVIGTDAQDFVEELVALNPDEEAGVEGEEYEDGDTKVRRDKLYYQAVEYILQQGKGSLSSLQAQFGIGYGRARRIIRFMEEDGIVGPDNGSKPRDVITTLGAWRRQRARNAAAPSPVRETALPQRRMPIKPAVIPTLRKNLRRSTCVEPEYEEPENDFFEPEYDEESYDENEEYAEDEYEFDDEEYEEFEEEEAPAPPPRRHSPTEAARFRQGGNPRRRSTVK